MFFWRKRHKGIKAVKITTYINPQAFKPARIVMLKSDRFAAWKLKGGK